MFPLIVHVGFHIGVVVVNICQVFMPLMPWATHMLQWPGQRLQKS